RQRRDRRVGKRRRGHPPRHPGQLPPEARGAEGGRARLRRPLGPQQPRGADPRRARSAGRRPVAPCCRRWRWTASSPRRSMPKADSGLVTLTGTAAWQYQRKEAEFVAGNVPGVADVDNQIALTTPQPTAGDIKQSIERALQRNANLDAEGLTVTEHGNMVMLSGAVSSWMSATPRSRRRGRHPASPPWRTGSSWSTERRPACGRR